MKCFVEIHWFIAGRAGDSLIETGSAAKGYSTGWECRESDLILSLPNLEWSGMKVLLWVKEGRNLNPFCWDLHRKFLIQSTVSKQPQQTESPPLSTPRGKRWAPQPLWLTGCQWSYWSQFRQWLWWWQLRVFVPASHHSPDSVTPPGRERTPSLSKDIHDCITT